MTVCAAVAAVVIATAPYEVDPADVTAEHQSPQVMCDAAGCTVAWTRFIPPTNYGVRILWLDGGVLPSNVTCGVSFGCRLEGLAGWNGLRFYVMDGHGQNGEQGVFLATTTQPNEAPSTANPSVLDGTYDITPRIGFAANAQHGMLAFDPKVGPSFFNVLVRPFEPDGGFAADASTAMTPGVNTVQDPSIVEVGGVFYVLYFVRGTGAQFDPYLVTVGPDGNILAPAVQLAVTTEDETKGAMVVAGDHLLVAWERDSNVELSRVDFDGGHGPALLAIDGGIFPVLSFVGDGGLFGFGRVGADVAIELHPLAGDGTVGPLVFSAQSPNTTSLALQQLDAQHAYLAYTVDDGGMSRAWLAPIDLTSPADAGGPTDGGGASDGGAPNDGGSGPDGGGAPDAGTAAHHGVFVACCCESTPAAPLLVLLAGFAARLRGRWRSSSPMRNRSVRH